ncbi:hypothetical protein QN367_19775, partial [Cryobacterium sp. RTS3]
GGINRARRVVYEAISAFRHQHNHLPREEPLSWEIPGLNADEQQNQNSRFQWGNTTTFKSEE